MFLISKDGLTMVNLENMNFIKVENAELVVNFLNEDIIIGKFDNEKEARVNLEEIINCLGKNSNKKVFKID